MANQLENLVETIKSKVRSLKRSKSKKPYRILEMMHAMEIRVYSILDKYS
ncbi:hypothetical protein C2S51_025535 [Perilla frutescens var. frutescens]|nr:hypothetical protein C2S51_025535 [Perilla frutescens var. frutescens]